MLSSPRLCDGVRAGDPASQTAAAVLLNRASCAWACAQRRLWGPLQRVPAPRRHSTDLGSDYSTIRHNVGSSGHREGAPKLAVEAPHGSAAPLITSTCTADSSCDFRQRSPRTHLTGKERAHLTRLADLGPCGWGCGCETSRRSLAPGARTGQKKSSGRKSSGP